MDARHTISSAMDHAPMQGHRSMLQHHQMQAYNAGSQSQTSVGVGMGAAPYPLYQTGGPGLGMFSPVYADGGPAHAMMNMSIQGQRKQLQPKKKGHRLGGGELRDDTDASDL